MVIETVLFDLDDTLIAEMEWARTGWCIVAEFLARRVPHAPAELERLMADAFMRDPRHVFDQVVSALGLDSGIVQECVRLYRTVQRPLSVLPDADLALQFAAALRTGIVTDGPASSQAAKVKGAALQSRVEVIVYTDSLGGNAGKPSPAGFREALARLQVPADTAVYVADNPAKDFIAPKRLGMRAIQVRRLGGLYTNLRAPHGAEPDLVIPTLCDLPEVIRAWGLTPRRLAST